MIMYLLTLFHGLFVYCNSKYISCTKDLINWRYFLSLPVSHKNIYLHKVYDILYIYPIFQEGVEIRYLDKALGGSIYVIICLKQGVETIKIQKRTRKNGG